MIFKNKENLKMNKKTVNLVMSVANDSGNGSSKTCIQYEDGIKDVSVTPSIYAPISGKESLPELDDSNVEELVNNMDIIIKSPAIKTTSEFLVGSAATNSGNALTAYNVEANTGKAKPDITVILPLAKIAYSALTHVWLKNKKQDIPSTINVSLANYLTCLPISEFSNSKNRELLQKKLCKGKHMVTIKNFKRDVKVTISFNLDHTFIYPEGIAAQIGLIYSSDNYLGFRNDALYQKTSPYENGQDYSNSGNTLLIDIGDGTTDISVMNGTHPLKGIGVNISLNQGVGTAAATASDQLAIDYPQLGHYTRSILLERASKDNQEGKVLRSKYLEPQINLLMKSIETEVEKEFRKANNDINTVVVLGGGVNLLTDQNKADFQKMLDSLNPFISHQKIWWIDSDHNQLLNLDGLRVFLTRKTGKTSRKVNKCLN